MILTVVSLGPSEAEEEAALRAADKQAAAVDLPLQGWPQITTKAINQYEEIDSRGGERERAAFSLQRKGLKIFCQRNKEKKNPLLFP